MDWPCFEHCMLHQCMCMCVFVYINKHVQISVYLYMCVNVTVHLCIYVCACIPKSVKCKNRSNGPVLLGLEEGWGWVGVSRGRDG